MSSVSSPFYFARDRIALDPLAVYHCTMYPTYRSVSSLSGLFFQMDVRLGSSATSKCEQMQRDSRSLFGRVMY